MKLHKIFVLLLSAALLLSGCMMRTVEEMYTPPKRSEDDRYLQSAIDSAMTGLAYAAPLSGENQQTVQSADLDGDGVEEFLLFARSDSDKPMKVLIFRQEGEMFRLSETIESQGSAFEQVEYVDFDNRPGLELVVGRKLSDQVPRSVSVYSFSTGQAEQLMAANYSKFLTCDLDSNGNTELMVIHPDESDSAGGMAVLYGFRDGIVERSREVALSCRVDAVRRIMVSNLRNWIPAVYVASSPDESVMITDILAMKDGVFTNVSFSNESGTSVQTLRNYYVYADDIDHDGILELPSLITMRPVMENRTGERQYLIRWFAMDLMGGEEDKLHTFHNFMDGWYLELSPDWANRLSVSQNGNAYSFYIWDEGSENAHQVFAVYTLTGADRESLALENNRFVLHRTEGVVYAARLEAVSSAYGIDQDDLLNSFHLIRRDWNTGET